MRDLKNQQEQAAEKAPAENADALKAEIARLKAANTELERKAEDAEVKAAAEAEAKARIEGEKSRLEKELQAKSDAVEAEVSRQEEAIRQQLKAQRKVRIVIASGRDPKDRCPVPVAVNGREYLIERDKEVDVPQGVLDVLDLAIEQVPTVVDEGGQSRTVFSPAKRFSYSVLGHVDPASGTVGA